VTSGDNVILATAVASPDPKEGIDFFPLTVEYREFTYAGGRIPGGFIKREGRPEREGDSDQPPDRSPDSSAVPGGLPQRDAGGRVRLLGGQGERSRRARHQRRKLRSGAERHSVPRPVGAVRVGYCRRQFIVNPTYAERAKSTLNIMVVGTKDGIVMVESGAKEVLEESCCRRDRVRAREIKKICAAIEDLVSRAGKTKRTVTAVEIDTST
jgi:polyribonucleotide nucleotidyltransferase